jgi:hypothetical protein
MIVSFDRMNINKRIIYNLIYRTDAAQNGIN